MEVVSQEKRGLRSNLNFGMHGCSLYDSDCRTGYWEGLNNNALVPHILSWKLEKSKLIPLLKFTCWFLIRIKWVKKLQVGCENWMSENDWSENNDLQVMCWGCSHKCDCNVRFKVGLGDEYASVMWYWFCWYLNLYNI